MSPRNAVRNDYVPVLIAPLFYLVTVPNAFAISGHPTGAAVAMLALVAMTMVGLGLSAGAWYRVTVLRLAARGVLRGT